MDKTVPFGSRRGTVKAPPSKSLLHRALICAALGSKEVKINCGVMPFDTEVTAAALDALIADIRCKNGVITVTPNRGKSQSAVVSCGQSGTTLRLLLPVFAALGKTVCFKTDKSLSKRPVKELCSELERHGAIIKYGEDKILLSEKLTCGDYKISGEISSQFVSGLLLSLPLLDGDSTLTVTGKTVSKPYISLTEYALKCSGISHSEQNGKYTVKGGQDYSYPEHTEIEGDYSSAAFFMCMGALGKAGVTVTGLNGLSLQGDKKITEILKRFGADVTAEKDFVRVAGGKLRGTVIDAADIPDLVPVLSVIAAVSDGETVIKNTKRLKLKETDRVKTVTEMIKSLGGNITAKENEIIIIGTKKLKGGTKESFGDHRIAMSLAVAASVCDSAVVIKNAECAEKSYKSFWKDFDMLEAENK